MNILVLDDLEIVRTGVSTYPYHNITSFERTDDCARFLKMLTRQSWDEVWLDHDLGQEYFNGMVAVDLILLLREVQVGLFVVTSMNTDARLRMTRQLLGARHAATSMPMSVLVKEFDFERR